MKVGSEAQLSMTSLLEERDENNKFQLEIIIVYGCITY